MKTKKEEIDSRWIAEQNQNEGSCWPIFTGVSKLSIQTAEASVMDICSGPYSLVGIISRFTDKQLCKKVMTLIKDQGLGENIGIFFKKQQVCYSLLPQM